MPYKTDTDKQVFFYEQEFYVLSNFSSFRLLWKGWDYDTSEAAYHSEKFIDHPDILFLIRNARSAHDAFHIAQKYNSFRRKDWDQIKVDIMREILLKKVQQHDYVRKKLLETGDRELIEDSWRDSYWGWGPDRNGQNVLGKLWMEIRKEINE